MSRKTRNRVIAGAAAAVLIAVACVSAFSYGSAKASMADLMAGDRAHVEERVLTNEPDSRAVESVTAPQVQEDTVKGTVFTLEVPLTESGLYPEQEAAILISENDSEREAERLADLEEAAEEPVYEPVYVPAPAPVTVPVQEVAPVMTDNQQENCVGDGLTY